MCPCTSVSDQDILLNPDPYSLFPDPILIRIRFQSKTFYDYEYVFFFKNVIYVFLNPHKALQRAFKLQPKRKLFKHEHEISSFLLILVCLDSDSGFQTHWIPDPIRIWIRNTLVYVSLP
jgi:hypothetical protein